MNAKGVFKIVHGLTMHFKTLEYSVLKYGHNTEHARKAWDKLTPGQITKYNWLSEKFTTTQDLVYAVLGCILDGVDIRYENSTVIMESFYKMKRRREGLEYFIKSDVSTVDMLGDVDFSKLIQRYNAGKLSPEYVIIRFGDELTSVYESPKYAFCAEKVLHLIKYRDFINVKRYQPLVHHEEATV